MKLNKENSTTQRIGTVVKNISGLEMKCINYRNSMDIDVEFLESGNIVKNVQWNNFIRGKVRNKCADKYNTKSLTPTDSKEYRTWYQMLRRCCDEQLKEDKPTYKDAICCEEWLSFESFCNWLYSQENYNVWKDLKWSAIDKDIICKGNKIYSPENCLLVPVNVNNLFVKHDALRGGYPIGVSLVDGKYVSTCMNSVENKQARIGAYDTPQEAFEAYKKYKEKLIKEIADIEYNKGAITEKCRNAMYAYRIEISD